MSRTLPKVYRLPQTVRNLRYEHIPFPIQSFALTVKIVIFIQGAHKTDTGRTHLDLARRLYLIELGVDRQCSCFCARGAKGTQRSSAHRICIACLLLDG
jgi:hypothetical protein